MSLAEGQVALDAATTARLVREKKLSPVETTETALAAITALDPRLHAFCTVAADEARAAATALETRIAEGDDPGPLAGVPVAIKDLVLTKGIRTAFGSRLYENFIPEDDDIAVERLRRAGAIVIGKTNVAEFGYGGIGHNPLFPTTRNPWNPTLTPGGSSAGSAAAVAAGIVPFAIGSDGGGSVRVPAAFTGLVGIKASMGRVPLWPGCRDARFPGVSGWESIEHIGPLARTVADAALMLSVIAGPDPRDRLSIPDEGVGWQAAAEARGRLGLKIAYCEDWGGIPVDARVRAIVRRAVTAFERDLGCRVEERPAPFGDVLDTYRAIVALETDIPGMRRMAEGREAELSPSVSSLLRRQWSADEFMAGILGRKRIVSAMTALMAKYDLVLTPTVPLLPFAVDQDGPGTIDGTAVADDAWSPACFPANLTGQPAASVPAGWTTDGLPVGLQIIGRHLADRTVVAAAAAYEASRPTPPRPPIHV